MASLVDILGQSFPSDSSFPGGVWNLSFFRLPSVTEKLELPIMKPREMKNWSLERWRIEARRDEELKPGEKKCSWRGYCDRFCIPFRWFTQCITIFQMNMDGMKLNWQGNLYDWKEGKLSTTTATGNQLETASEPNTLVFYISTSPGLVVLTHKIHTKYVPRSLWGNLSQINIFLRLWTEYVDHYGGIYFK